jgi:hypothetical protein
MRETVGSVGATSVRRRCSAVLFWIARVLELPVGCPWRSCQGCAARFGRMGHDVVVVEGGSAGCVLAARLSEDTGRRVMLVEAGPDCPDMGGLPGDVLDASEPTVGHDWGYTPPTKCWTEGSRCLELGSWAGARLPTRASRCGVRRRFMTGGRRWEIRVGASPKPWRTSVAWSATRTSKTTGTVRTV